MPLVDFHTRHGAALAPDGIPLHFGDLATEYRAALDHAVLLDRSHEGRLRLTGRDRLSLLHRISTNDLLTLREGEGRATVFLNANGRILERAVVYNAGESTWLLTEPGRGASLGGYLSRNIFFNDDAQLSDLASKTHQFALHGVQADGVVGALFPNVGQIEPLHSMVAEFEGAQVFIARNKPLVGSNWSLIVPFEVAESFWTVLINTGAPFGLRPAGSLTYNVLRIRAGRPGIGRELSSEYIPLEVGLWDEISFHKGCYTGQEIIARMESRNRLAKVMVTLQLDRFVEAPGEIIHDGRSVGTLTSSATTPDGEIFAIGVIKTALSQSEETLHVGADAVPARVAGMAAVPPPMVQPD